MTDQIYFNDVKNCRLCGSSDLTPYLNLGNMPLVNRLLTAPGDWDPKFPLEVYHCGKCSQSQLGIVVDPKVLFSDYPYRSSMSRTYIRHCFDMAELAKEQLGMSRGDLVVDIASNDGALLKQFKGFGVRVLGVDPASNLAKIATEEGVPTLAEFWPGDIPERILQNYGPAKIITATNVFAHVSDVHEFLKGVSTLLAGDGTFIVEFPYMVDLIESGCFDTIYHEHLSYFLVGPLIKLFEEHDLKVSMADRLPIHGGSVRLYITKNGQIDSSVRELVEMERAQGYHTFDLYSRFSEKIGNVKRDLLSLLYTIRNRGESIAGFGAAAKGTILLNYCDIGPETIPFIFDDTPEKQGLYIPGVHIPIVPRAELDERRPDNLLVLPWNFLTEIVSRTATFGGSYIVVMPEMKVLKPERTAEIHISHDTVKVKTIV